MLRRTLAEIFNECIEGIHPSLANHNSSAPIVLPLLERGVSASLLHCRPNRVLRCSCEFWVRRQPLLSLAATTRCPAGIEIAGEPVPCVPAITEATDAIVDGPCLYSKPAKFLTDNRRSYLQRRIYWLSVPTAEVVSIA